MKKFILALTVALMLPTLAHAQVGFLLGYALGSAGSRSEPGKGPSSILYQASGEVLDKVNPLAVQVTANEACFGSAYNKNRAGSSLWELFSEVIGKDARLYTILRIEQVLDPRNPCSVFWFTYAIGGKK